MSYQERQPTWQTARPFSFREPTSSVANMPPAAGVQTVAAVHKSGSAPWFVNDLLMGTTDLREKMVADKHRPRYQLVLPEGRWNDIKGLLYWKGRYHIGYLLKIANGSNQRDFSSWQHVSSRDLVHWRYHTASLHEPLERLIAIFVIGRKAVTPQIW